MLNLNLSAELRKDERYNKLVNKEAAALPFHYITASKDAFTGFVRNGNIGVGPLTLKFERLQVTLRESDLRTARKLITKKYGKGGTNDYVGLPRNTVNVDGKDFTIVDVSKHLIDKIIAEAPNVNWHKLENVRNFILDGDVCGRFYQEMVIDSAKTKKKVDVDYDLTATFRPKGLGYYTTHFDPRSMTFSYDEPYMEMDTTKMTVIDDEMADLTKEFLDQIKELVENDLAGIEHGFSETELKDFEIFNTKKYQGVVDSVRYLARIFKDVIGDYRINMDERDDDEDFEDKAKAAFKARMKLLGDVGRYITRNYSMIDRAKMFQFVSISVPSGNNVGQIRTDGGNSFATSVIPEEYTLMIGEDSEINFAGLPLILNDGYVEGDVVTFEHGVAEHAMIMDDVTEELVIREYNGELYATKLIADMIQVDIPDTDSIVLPIKLKQGFTVGKEDDVIKKLAEVDEIFISATSWYDRGRKYSDYALYAIENGKRVKISDIDVQGIDYMKLINGKIANLREVIKCTVNAYGSNAKSDKTLSLIVCVDKLRDAGTTPVSSDSGDAADWDETEETEMPW